MRKALIVIISALALLGLASAAHAAGVGQWNAPMCGPNAWERIKTPQTEFAAIDSAKTCVSSERYHATFAVSRVIASQPWQYPGLVAGYIPTGEPTCASAADTCFTFPVQVDRDGTPAESFGSWISRGYQGNESNDIWFSPVKGRHSYADKAGDTEIMIWFAYPGGNGGHKITRHVSIDGMWWGVMDWTAGGPHKYVAYLWLGAPAIGGGKQVSISGLRLNPFFRDAEKHGWLKPSEWLWSIGLGFEMRENGARDNAHNWELTGLPVNSA